MNDKRAQVNEKSNIKNPRGKEIHMLFQSTSTQKKSRWILGTLHSIQFRKLSILYNYNEWKPQKVYSKKNGTELKWMDIQILKYRERATHTNSEYVHSFKTRTILHSFQQIKKLMQYSTSLKKPSAHTRNLKRILKGKYLGLHILHIYIEGKAQKPHKQNKRKRGSSDLELNRTKA